MTKRLTTYIKGLMKAINSSIDWPLWRSPTCCANPQRFTLVKIVRPYIERDPGLLSIAVIGI